MLAAARAAGDHARPGRRQDSGVTWSGAFTLTATSAPESFAIQAPAGLTVQPDSGTVVPGAPVTITVSLMASDSVPFQSVIGVSPAGLSVVVEFPPSSPAPSSSPPSSASPSSPVPSGEPSLSSPPPSS